MVDRPHGCPYRCAAVCATIRTRAEPFSHIAGLFPSNYVERIEPAVHVNHRASAHMAPSATYKASNLNSYNHSSSSHSATNSIGLTQPAVDEPKKSKYDGLKKTMANSAAGGVGFGAGSLCPVTCA